MERNLNDKILLNAGIIIQCNYQEFLDILAYIDEHAKVVFNTTAPRWKRMYVRMDDDNDGNSK